MVEYEITIKYTRKIDATDKEQLLDAIDITQKTLMSCDYEILEIKEIDKKEICPNCQGKGYYWKQPLPDYLIPSGNYGRLGNEVKAPCPFCKPGGLNDIFKKKKK